MAEIDTRHISDQELRDQALAIGRSFIVQAPAGSGKTELLTQRYLRLLSQVDNPEEILAVTFTRKAAAEMRNRIINAIYPPPNKNDKRLDKTIELANQVLERDRDRGWQLAKHPARLRIRTIDSVNAWLSATAPLAGREKATSVSETPAALYRLAAQRVVEQAGDSDGGAVRTLLMHLDNRTESLVRLLAGMLGRRDQWLDIAVKVGGVGQMKGGARADLEQVLHELVSLEIRKADLGLKSSQRHEIFELMQFAAGNLVEQNPDSTWSAVLGMNGFPEASADTLEAWQFVAEFLLTRGGTFRKRLTVKEGFPAGGGPKKEFKTRALELNSRLLETSELEPAFAVIRGLPKPCYTENQWAVLEALLEILQLAAAQLKLVFVERGEADYPAVAQSAIEALREEDDAPTDLALRLDFRIRHILIDEFQDTSSAQLELLLALTAGWEEGDGRTLFVVGDPMQSIYRFRKAEVGLFLGLQDEGLSNIELISITLKTNFRSDPSIVEWVNEVFGVVMPTMDDRTTGAVSFAASSAARRKDESDTTFVTEHALTKPSRVDEAEQIVDLVEENLERWPEDDIGILVRSRKHAALIVTELRKREIPFSGTGLENSIETPVVQDLLCITRALSHRADRTAWLGLLRAPWCGLSLADLEALAGEDQKNCIWDLLNDEVVLNRLTAGGQARVERVLSVLTPVFSRRGSLPLRDVVEGVWVELGGPAFLTDATDIERAEAFFVLLDQYDIGGDCADVFILHEQIADKLKVEDRKARVNLLTIHKAKGLEFDTVILPALDVGTRGDDKPMLAWQESVRPNGETGLVIAPMERTGEDKDSIYEFARRLNKVQDAYEKDRLLYVATTRARLRLHLFFGVAVDADNMVKVPAKNSLLARLWPAIGQRHTLLQGEPGREATLDAWLHPTIFRYSDGWSVPGAPVEYRLPAPVAVDERMRDVTYDWASPMAKHVGTVVHRWFDKITREGSGKYDPEGLKKLRPVFSHMLIAEGIDAADLDKGIALVEKALSNTLTDEIGRWILSEEHSEAASEYPVTLVRDNRMQSLIIDRTFVDDAGVRWIVDYKTSSHEGGGLDAFLDEEERRYSEQLESYRQAMQLLEPEREIKTALYFPLLQKLHEVICD